MIRVMLQSKEGSYLAGGAELLQQWKDTPDSRVWLDINGEQSEDVRTLLKSMHCDDLAITDCFRTRHPPKVEQFEDSTFILFRGISQLDESLELEPQQIGFWIGQRHLITVHGGDSVSIAQLWGREKDQPLLQRPWALALGIIHYSCGLYLEKLLDFEVRIGELEDGLLSARSEEDMKELVVYRSRLRRLRRVFSYHKALAENIWQMGGLYLGDSEPDSDHIRRDVFDRCERLYSLSHMYYELCGDLVDGHISLSSHNLNQTMKLLTIISALFVPLTFVAGVYGMNFENMPELSWKYAYFAVLGVMAVMAISMLVLFRRIRWL